MAVYYVWSGATGAGTGADYTNAYTAFGSAVTAATANGDRIHVAHDHAEDLAADTTYTFLENVRVVCTNRSTDAATTGARIGHTTLNRAIVLSGAFKVFISGTKWQIAGSTTDSMTLGGTDGSHFEFETCEFVITNTAASATILTGAANGNGFVKFSDCTFSFAATGQSLQLRGAVEMNDCVIDPAGSAPTTLLTQGSASGSSGQFVGCDFSHVTGTLVGSQGSGKSEFVFQQCKLGSGVVVLATQTPANKSAGRAYIFDCASGDQHYHFQYHDAFGSLTVDTGIYANDNLTYDGTNKCSWKIVTTANCSYYTPFVSPWITKYNSGTSAVTPSFEILRDGSTTAYQDDEVWGEWAYKGTANVTLASLVNDRMALLGTAADQAAGVGLSGWTGEGGSAWSGKLAPGSTITPTEIGDISGRIVVGEPSITLYVDPQIRGV